MKNQFLFLFLIAPGPFFAQLTETIVSDTNFVRFYKSAAEKGDTSYYLTNNRPIGKWIVYFDEAKTQKALETEFFDRSEYKFNTTEWYRNGNLKCKIRLSPQKDTSTQEYFYKNGQLQNKTIYKWNNYQGVFSGVVDSSYYENGQIKRTPIDWTSLKKQHIIDFYESGVKEKEFNWVNGTLVEEFKQYHANGKLKIIGNYLYPKDLDPTLAPHLRTDVPNGIWKYYDEKGKLVKQEVYNNGKLISTKE